MNEFSEDKTLEILGARENNLKNIDLSIPRNALVVVTGISGSGKSSLAFDTIYAEGQRRYMESFSAYARQFIGNMERPDVDLIEGLSPFRTITDKLYFDYGTEKDDAALYSEMIPGGYVNVTRNPEGVDSKVSVEILFNTVMKNKETIKQLFG